MKFNTSYQSENSLFSLTFCLLQKVRLNNKFSDWCDVLSGVSQDSVLRPFLFLIYINNIDKYIVYKLEKFADDTKLRRGISNNNDADISRSDLNKIDVI